jgi:hypothetical protein
MTQNQKLENEVQPDISEVIADLSSQVAALSRDAAIQRSIINQLNKKIVELEKK